MKLVTICQSESVEYSLKAKYINAVSFLFSNAWHSHQVGLVRRVILLRSHPHQAVIVEEDP